MRAVSNTRNGLFRATFIAAGALLSCATSEGIAAGETLADAISLAYQSNPSLQAQRAQLRALDESYVQARAGWRPTASAQIVASYSKEPETTIFGGTAETESNSGQGLIGLTQPIYTGGRTAAEVRATQADVEAGREALREAEGGTLQNVVSAYCDVLRDQIVLSIHQSDVELLQQEAIDAKARLQAGEITRTDVAQIDTQLAQSRTSLSGAQGQLQISRSSYAAVVGQNPENLLPPPDMPGVPSDVDKAFDIAEQESPSLLQAQNTEEASRARVAEARAGGRPTVSLSANFGYTGEVRPFYARQYDEVAVGSITLTQPLLTGGVTASNVRKALELNTSDRINIEVARRNTVQAVSQAWNQLITERIAVQSETQAVQSAEAYFAGVKAEYGVGQRSTLDIIVAEQSLISAQQSLAVAQHDAYVASALVLYSIGRLEARYVVPAIPRYDPAVSFRRVAKSGALPWEGVIAAIDSMGAPKPRADAPISATVVSEHTALGAAAGGPAADAPLSTQLPTAPYLGTTSPATPPTLRGRLGTSDEVSAAHPVPTNQTAKGQASPAPATSTEKSS